MKDLFEIGLSRTSQGLVGRYREHDVRIEEHWLSPESGQTSYLVVFSNPRGIVLHIKKRRTFPIGGSYLENRLGLREIKVDEKFDREFIVKGNYENEIKAILDPYLLSRIACLREFLDENRHQEMAPAIEIGYPEDPKQAYMLNGSLLPYVDDLNLAQYKDPFPIVFDAFRSRLILDALIDIIQKLES